MDSELNELSKKIADIRFHKIDFTVVDQDKIITKWLEDKVTLLACITAAGLYSDAEVRKAFGLPPRIPFCERHGVPEGSLDCDCHEDDGDLMSEERPMKDNKFWHCGKCTLDRFGNYCEECGTKRPEEKRKKLELIIKYAHIDKGWDLCLGEEQYKIMAEAAIKVFEEMIDSMSCIITVSHEKLINADNLKSKLRELL